jgi:hypothetical protein
MLVCQQDQMDTKFRREYASVESRIQREYRYTSTVEKRQQPLTETLVRTSRSKLCGRTVSMALEKVRMATVESWEKRVAVII